MFLILILRENNFLSHDVFVYLIIAIFAIGVVMGPLTREIIDRRSREGSGANQ
jgi:hypothetical protein